MKLSQVALQEVPPLRLPLGYFRIAPVFGLIAGLFLLYSGEAAWANRWTREAWCAVHLLVLGCMTMIMMGALAQVLPVISSAAIPWGDRLAPWTRLFLSIGALTLAGGLWLGSSLALWVAGGALILGFATYVIPLSYCLARPIGGGDSILGIRLAVLCLLGVITFGAWQLTGHVLPTVAPTFRLWLPLHIGLAFGGWIGILIMAVSFQVLPMFHVAPEYPRWFSRLVPLLLVVGIACSLWWFVAAGLLVYAGLTLYLLGRRKRRAADVTVRFWQSGMLLLLAGIVAWWTSPVPETTVGVVFLVGFALTVMVGMLYKIVPFLVFLHLQRASLTDVTRIQDLPSMHQILPPWRGRWQYSLHLLCVLLCIVATFFPVVGRVAGLALVADFAWLLLSIHVGYRSFRRLVEAWGLE